MKDFKVKFDGDEVSSDNSEEFNPETLKDLFENYEPPKRFDVIGIDAVTKIISALTFRTSNYRIHVMTDSHQAQKEDTDRAFIIEIWEK